MTPSVVLVSVLLIIAPGGETLRLAGPWYGTDIVPCLIAAAPFRRAAHEAGFRVTCRATSQHEA